MVGIITNIIYFYICYILIEENKIALNSKVLHLG